MKNYSGEVTPGPEFYKLLYANNEFCANLGRSILAAGRLESELKLLINRHSSDRDMTKATLGRLIVYARGYELLTKMLPVLETLKDQRNYLTHNIHALLTGLIEETVLEGGELLAGDVFTYSERAWQLTENLNHLADIVSKENNKLDAFSYANKQNKSPI